MYHIYYKYIFIYLINIFHTFLEVDILHNPIEYSPWKSPYP